MQIASRFGLLRRIGPIALKRTRVDDFDVDVVSFPKGCELGRNGRQTHPQLSRNLLGIDLMDVISFDEDFIAA